MANEVGLGITIECECARLPQKIVRAASYNLCITCVAWLNTLSSEIDIRAPTSEVMDKDFVAETVCRPTSSVMTCMIQDAQSHYDECQTHDL